VTEGTQKASAEMAHLLWIRCYGWGQIFQLSPSGYVYSWVFSCGQGAYPEVSRMRQSVLTSFLNPSRSRSSTELCL